MFARVLCKRRRVSANYCSRTRERFGRAQGGEKSGENNDAKMNEVWVSRPRRRAFALARELRKQKLIPVLHSAMRIVAAPNNHFRLLLSQPNFYDLAIFVSEEAAYRCRKLNSESPIPCLAIGDATFAAAEKIPACAAIRADAGEPRRVWPGVRWRRKTDPD